MRRQTLRLACINTAAAPLFGLAAIAGSTNMALARTFAGAITVPFGGESDDVFGDMLGALRSGEVDAVVDDDVVIASLDADPDFALAFTVRTGNRWGIAVGKGQAERSSANTAASAAAGTAAIDAALAAVIADGRLAAAWREWLPSLEYPTIVEA